MSLSNKGNITNIASAIASFSKTSGFGGDGIAKLAKTINQFSNIDDVTNLLVKSGVSSDIAQKALEMSSFKGSIEDVSIALKGVKAAESESTLKDVQPILTKTTDGFKNLGVAIKEFAKTPLGIGAITAGLLMVYGTIMTKLNPSLKSMNSLANEKLTTYQNAQSDVEGVQSKLDEVKSKIAEINAQPLTMTTQSELDNLNATKAQLEQELAIKQNIAKVDQEAAAEAAKAAMSAKSSDNATAKASSNRLVKLLANTGIISNDSAGGYAARFAIDSFKDMYLGGLGQLYTLYSTFKGGRGTLGGMFKIAGQTETESVTADIEKYKELQSQQKALRENLAIPNHSGDYYTKLHKSLDTVNKDMSTISSDLTEKQSSIQSKLTAMTDDSGNAIQGFEEEVSVLKSSLNEIANSDTSGLTDMQKATNTIQSAFANGQNGGISEYLSSLASAGADTNTLVDAMTSLGFSIDGVSKYQIASYFKEMAQSANEAAEAAQKVDGSLSGVEAAFKSENSGDNFVSMKDYIDKAKTMYDQGLTGTDDFKTVAEMISDGVDSSAENFQANYDNIQKYFTVDDKGTLTKDGIQTFVDEFDALGQKFTTTGEAAHSMGMSVEVFEALMGRMQDYDMSFATESLNEFVKSAESLKDGQDSLSALEETVNSLSDSSKKTELTKNIAQWKDALAGYENDLSTLNPEVIATIKFQLDMAQLKAKIDDAKAIIDNGGGSAQNYANLISYQQTYNKQESKQTGLDSLQAEQIPVNVTASDQSIAALQQQLKSATSEEERVKIQPVLYNLEEAKGQLLDAFASAHPEITPETDPSVVEATWNEFVNSAEGQTIYANLGLNTQEANNSINDFKDGGYTTTITLTPDESLVTEAVNNTDGGTRTTTFNSDLSIVNQDVSKTDGGTRTTIFNPLATALDAVTNDKNGGQRTTYYEANTSGLPTSFSALTRTVYYNYVSNGGDSSLYLSGEHSLNGTAHMYGTAGHAFASGNWGTKDTHNALVGELGPELVVNGSNWYTVGTDGAEFTKIPRGSIVFNHKQTEEIFRNGYVSASNGGGRGHALAGGTAFASGTAFADGSGDSDSFSEEFDRAAIALSLVKRVLDNVKSSIDEYSHNLAEQNAVTESTLTQVQASIDYNRAGYETYMAKANAVGLDEEWKRKVQVGAWEIDNITDKDLKTKIDDYKNYYDKAIDCQDAIQTSTAEFADVAKQKLSNIENHFSNIISYNKDFGIYQSVSELKDALSQYQSDLDSEVSRGYIKEYSDNWYKSMTQIADYMQNIFDATINDFTTIINGLESASKNLENAEKLKEANGSTINESDYQSQIDNNNKLIQEYAQKRQALLKQQSTYDAGTDKYKDLADDIDSADSSIYDLISANEKLKDSIYELRFKPLDDGIKKMQSLVDETDDFRDLLNEDAFYDENGILSAEGTANIALITQNLGSVKQEIADYRTGLEKLQESLDNNVISQEEYNEKSEDYISGAQKAAKSVSSYREALLKMNETQMKADNSSLKENITLRKNALKATKDYYDYQETLKSKTKDVNALKAQIAALSGVNNAASQAKLKSLKSDLADAQDELTNTKRDHAYEMITDGYDTMADNLDDTLEKTTNAINESSAKQEEVISSMLNSIVGKYSDAYSKINEIVSTTGWIWSSTGAINAGQIGSSAGISSSISNALKSVSNTSGSSYASNVSSTGVKDNSAYNSSLTTSMSGDNDTTNRKCGSLTLSTSSMTLQAGSSGNISVNIKPNDAANKTILWTSSNPAVATVSSGIISAISAGAATIIASTTDGSNLSAVCGLSVSPKPQEQPSNGGSSSGGSSSSGGGGGSDYSDNGIPFEYQVDYTDASNLNTNTSIVDRLKYFNYASDFNHRKILYDYFHANDGVDYVGSAYQNMQLIEDMKVRGYAAGTRSAMSGLAFTNEEGLGTELMLTKGGALQQLNGGETIFSKAQTEKLWQLSKNNISDSLGQGGRSSLYNVERAESSVDVHFDNLINVEGNVDKDALPGLQEICEKAYDYTTNRIKKEIRKI